jgi:hypothetical protein
MPSFRLAIGLIALSLVGCGQSSPSPSQPSPSPSPSQPQIEKVVPGLSRLLGGGPPTGATPAAESSTATDAIKEAISLLEARKAKIADKAELKKMNAALEMLEQLMKAAPAEGVNIVDLIDNTANYKGKTITLELSVDTPIFAEQRLSIQDLVGESTGISFSAIGPKSARLNIIITCI